MRDGTTVAGDGGLEDVAAVVGNGAAHRIRSLRPAAGVASAREADDAADKQNHPQIQLTSSVDALMCRCSTSDGQKVLMLGPTRTKIAALRDRRLRAECRGKRRTRFL